MLIVGLYNLEVEVNASVSEDACNLRGNLTDAILKVIVFGALLTLRQGYQE